MTILSKRPFFTALVILVCLLGAMNYAQNPAQSPLTADDFNQFTLAVDWPDDLLGAHHRLRRPARAEPDLLRADRLERRLEDRGRRHLTSSRSSRRAARSAWAGWPSRPPNQNILYLGTGEPMHARSSTHGNGVWKSTDAGKTWTKVGLEKSYFIPKVEVDSKNPDIVYVAAEGQALRQRDGLRARPLQEHRRRQDLDEHSRPMKDRGVGRLRHRPAQLRRRSSPRPTRPSAARGRTSTAQPGNELYKSTDGGKTWKKLTSGLPQGVAARPHGPRDLREEPEHRLRARRRGSEPRLPGARRRRQLPRAGGRRARRRRRGRRLRRRGATSGRTRRLRRSRRSSSTRCSSKRPGSKFTPFPAREGSRLRHEVQRGDRRQGLPDEERHRRGEVHAGGAQDVREGRGNDDRRSTSSRS